MHQPRDMDGGSGPEEIRSNDAGNPPVSTPNNIGGVNTDDAVIGLTQEQLKEVFEKRARSLAQTVNTESGTAASVSVSPKPTRQEERQVQRREAIVILQQFKNGEAIASGDVLLEVMKMIQANPDTGRALQTFCTEILTILRMGFNGREMIIDSKEKKDDETETAGTERMTRIETQLVALRSFSGALLRAVTEPVALDNLYRILKGHSAEDLIDMAIEFVKPAESNRVSRPTGAIRKKVIEAVRQSASPDTGRVDRNFIKGLKTVEREADVKPEVEKKSADGGAHKLVQNQGICIVGWEHLKFETGKLLEQKAIENDSGAHRILVGLQNLLEQLEARLKDFKLQTGHVSIRRSIVACKDLAGKLVNLIPKAPKITVKNITDIIKPGSDIDSDYELIALAIAIRTEEDILSFQRHIDQESHRFSNWTDADKKAFQRAIISLRDGKKRLIEKAEKGHEESLDNAYKETGRLVIDAQRELPEKKTGSLGAEYTEVQNRRLVRIHQYSLKMPDVGTDEEKQRATARHAQLIKDIPEEEKAQLAALAAGEVSPEEQTRREAAEREHQARLMKSEGFGSANFLDLLEGGLLD